MACRSAPRIWSSRPTTEMDRLLIVGSALSPAQTLELMLRAEAQYAQHVRETGASLD